MKPGKNRIIATGLACAVVLIAAMALLLATRKPALEIDPRLGKVFSPAIALPPFDLIDHHSQPFSNDRLRGHWTLAMIGFTYCPDVCPLTLAEIAGFYKNMDQLPEKITAPEFVFLSVDPFRDTPATLSEYLEYFRPGFIGLTGTPAAIHSLVNQLGLYYMYHNPKEKAFLNDVLHKPPVDDYAVIHSTSLLFINPQGQLVAIMSQPFKATDILTFYQRLLAFYGDH